jgi:hypothetical protein
MISLESNFVMPTILQSIQILFNDHQARLAAVSAAPGVVGLSLDLDQMSATYLSKAVQILVRPKYAVGAPSDQTSRFLHLAPPFRSYRPRGGPVRERLAEHLRGHLSRE